jgi:hypothetical protein
LSGCNDSENSRHHIRRLWLRTLRRRSQKDRFPWERMDRLANDFLPQPQILHPWPSVRFAVRWLAQVIRGYFAYHAVPTNVSALSAFRQEGLFVAYASSPGRTASDRGDKSGVAGKEESRETWRRTVVSSIPPQVAFIVMRSERALVNLSRTLAKEFSNTQHAVDGLR